MICERQQWGRLLNGRNFSEAEQGRHAAFGTADWSRLWPRMGGKLPLGLQRLGWGPATDVFFI